jgi:HYR domain-containing protein/immunoglobulin I-set domain protein
LAGKARTAKADVSSERQQGRRPGANFAATRRAVSPATPTPVAPIDVDRTDDDASANLCTAAPNDCSLRGAVSFANGLSGTTINLPAGTYNLTISGAGEGFSGNNAIGDLDIRGNNTSIVGAGSAFTTIQQTTSARVIEVNPFLNSGFNFSISGVTISGGQENTGVGGGGIISGGLNNTTTITDSIISGNSATGSGTFGGGGHCNTGGSVVISGTTFSGNSTSGSGGAISYSAGDFLSSGSTGTLTVTNSSFSSNTANSSSAGGGAIDVFNFNLGNTSASIGTSAFSTNSAANGRGGAVIVESGSADVQYSRLVGNTAATGGRTVHRVSGTLTADNNWWGANSGPSVNANSGGNILVWLQLRASANPDHACAGATVNMSADIYGTGTSLGSGNPVMNCPGASCPLNGLPSFAGTVGATSTQFVNGAASGSFIAGTDTPSAAADSETVTASFTVDPAPSVVTNPTNQQVCEGSSVSFTASATTGTVQWQISTNGGGTFTDISGATNTTLSFTAAASQNGNQYRAVFTNGCGSATSTAATLTVNTAPVVTLNPMSQTVSGGNATFTAAASGSPTPTVQWEVSTNGGASFTPMAGETNTTLVVAATLANDGNQYRAVFTNTCGTATTTAATLTICIPPTVTSNPVSVADACVGAPVTFSASANGTPTPTVQWQVSTNGGATFTNISGATSTTLTVTATVAVRNNQYRAVFTNACGTATTSAATLGVDSTPPTISCPANIVLEPTCPSGAIATYTAPVGSDNCPGATTTRTAGLASGSVFPIGTTTVTYTVTDAAGNSASCSFSVTVKSAAATVQDLITRTQALQPPLTGPQAQGLVSKLNQALTSINSGNLSAACGKLADYVTQVQNYINNGTLSSAQGQPLIDSANRVRNTIGCTSLGCS